MGRLAAWIMAVALLGTTIWMRIETARLEERYRVLCDRQEAVEEMVSVLPALLETALAQHRQRLIAWMEARND